MIKLSVKNATNIKDRVMGLIGKEKPIPLMIKTRFGIHTFGLKFTIDVLVLDNKNKVASIKKNLKPNRIFLWNPRYKKVIELPQGVIEKKVIKSYDTIDLKQIRV